MAKTLCEWLRRQPPRRYLNLLSLILHSLGLSYDIQKDEFAKNHKAWLAPLYLGNFTLAFVIFKLVTYSIPKPKKPKDYYEHFFAYIHIIDAYVCLWLAVLSKPINLNFNIISIVSLVMPIIIGISEYDPLREKVMKYKLKLWRQRAGDVEMENFRRFDWSESEEEEDAPLLTRRFRAAPSTIVDGEGGSGFPTAAVTATSSGASRYELGVDPNLDTELGLEERARQEAVAAEVGTIQDNGVGEPSGKSQDATMTENVHAHNNDNDQMDNEPALMEHALVMPLDDPMLSQSGGLPQSIHVPPSTGALSDVLTSTPMLTGDGEGGSGFAAAAAAASGYELGVDPELDLKLALALGVPMEEEGARQEAVAAEDGIRQDNGVGEPSGKFQDATMTDNVHAHNDDNDQMENSRIFDWSESEEEKDDAPLLTRRSRAAPSTIVDGEGGSGFPTAAVTATSSGASRYELGVDPNLDTELGLEERARQEAVAADVGNIQDNGVGEPSGKSQDATMTENVHAHNNDNDQMDNEPALMEHALVMPLDDPMLSQSGGLPQSIHVPPSTGALSDVLTSTPMLTGDGEGGSGFAAAAAAASGYELGVDPELDLKLALALGVPMEEEGARQEAVAAEDGIRQDNGVGEPSGKSQDATMTDNVHAHNDDTDQMENETALLKKALAMPLDDPKPSQSGGLPILDADMLDAGEDQDLALALQMSAKDAATDSASQTVMSHVLGDESFMSSILGSRPGLDPNDPSVRDLLASLQAQGETKDHDNPSNEAK